ncbi:MAG TPA: DUF364 domain-containing protein [Rhizomicrobium sp.]
MDMGLASLDRTSTVQKAPAAEAAWIRPGVVVHQSAETVDRLLEAFAFKLRQRGFNVAGYVQRSNSGCTGKGLGCAPNIEYLDLSTNQTVSVERAAATAYLRRAMRDNADLLVISRFAGSIASAAWARPGGNNSAQGLPLLTSIAGQCIHKWFDYARQDGAMISPDLKSLWAWWGAERLYRDLALGVAEHEVCRIACGTRWIMVEGPFGAGLAYLPRSPRELLPQLPHYAGLSLRELAALSQSWDPLKMALGIAAINAHYNRYDLDAASGNGVRTFRGAAGRVVVIGAFPGIDGILPHCAVIEADPRPGEYPAAAMDTLLPVCGGAIVNASALINRSLPRILRLASNRPVALIGPATPMTPRLHDYGLSLLGGFIVRDANGLAAAIRAGVLPKDFGRFGRYVHLSCGEPAAS